MDKPESRIAVTFDIGYLAQLALAEAETLGTFKGKPIRSRCVFSDPDKQWFLGIEVFSGNEE